MILLKQMIRCPWRATAGLLLALAAGPLAAQGIPDDPYGRPNQEIPDQGPPRQAAHAEASDGTTPLPAPRQLPATAAPSPGSAPAAAAPQCGTADSGGSKWQRWKAEQQARCQANMWGYPEEFKAPPLGAVMRANFLPMVANGQAAGMVLFSMDFLQGCGRLNAHGQDRLVRMATRLPHNMFQIIVERTPEEPKLAEARRASVLIELARAGFNVPPERVVVGPRLSVGLPGADAILIQQSYRSNLQTQGQPISVPSLGGGVGTGGAGTAAGGAGGGAQTGVGVGGGGP